MPFSRPTSTDNPAGITLSVLLSRILPAPQAPFARPKGDWRRRAWNMHVRSAGRTLFRRAVTRCRIALTFQARVYHGGAADSQSSKLPAHPRVREERETGADA